jgi:hypothetical protein
MRAPLAHRQRHTQKSSLENVASERIAAELRMYRAERVLFHGVGPQEIRRTPCPEIIDAIPTTPAERFPLSASRRNSNVRLRARRRWGWRRWGWWRRRRSRRWRCEYGRRQRRGGRHRRGYGGKCGKHHPQRNSPAGPNGSRNAWWRRPGRLKFRRSVERKHGGRSGRDRGAGAAHHQRSERWGRAKC